MKYVIADRETYERQIEQIQADQEHRCAGGVGDNGVSRLRRAIELIDIGLESDDARDGLLVNDKIVVAVKSSKFRYAGSYSWQSFKKIQDVTLALAELVMARRVSEASALNVVTARNTSQEA